MGDDGANGTVAALVGGAASRASKAANPDRPPFCLEGKIWIAQRASPVAGGALGGRTAKPPTSWSTAR